MKWLFLTILTMICFGAIAQTTYTYDATGNRIAHQAQGINAVEPVISVPQACPGEQIQVSAVGGTAPYNYAWNNGSNTDASFALPNGSTNRVTVTDALGCTGTASVPSNNVDCFGGGCLTEEITVSTNPLPANTYLTTTTITSSGTVQSATTVRFIAQERVTLLAGFRATPGSDFLAAISPCAPENNIVELDEVTAQSLSAPESNWPPEISLVLPQDIQVVIGPNPFCLVTKIQVHSPKAQSVNLQLFSLQGQLIRKVSAQRTAPAKSHEFWLEASGLAAGQYLLLIRTEEQLISRQLVRIAN